jgi:4'-phosphopantetheinyl transferase EntD
VLKLVREATEMLQDATAKNIMASKTFDRATAAEQESLESLKESLEQMREVKAMQLEVLAARDKAEAVLADAREKLASAIKMQETANATLANVLAKHPGIH